MAPAVTLLFLPFLFWLISAEEITLHIGEPKTIDTLSEIALLKAQLNYRKAFISIVFNEPVSGIYYSSSPIVFYVDSNNKTVINETWCADSVLCSSSQDFANGIKGNYTFPLNSCMDYLYFAIVPFGLSTSNVTTITITSSDAPCNDFPIPDRGCAGKSPLLAKSTCIPGCVVLDCLNNKSESILSLVVPKTLNETQQEDRCAAAFGLSDRKITDTCQNNSIIEDLSIGEIVIISLIVFMLLCCISTIVYYNYKFCKNNEPPFVVPECCPTCLFPRAYSMTHEDELDSNERDSAPVSRYNAPPPRPEYYIEAE